MTKDCKGILGWLFGHKFESCFDENSEPSLKQYDIDSLDAARIIESLAKRESKFVGAFCKRCGQSVKREGLEY